MSQQVDSGPLTAGSRLDPVAQSRGYLGGGGQFPAGPAGPNIAPDGLWKVGSNSFAKSGLSFGVLAIPLGWIPAIGYLFALGFAGVGLILGAIGFMRAQRFPGMSGRIIAVLAMLLCIGVIIWKIIEGVGPPVVISGPS
ncbi:MAG TPA: hypothetical protein VI434_02140 [Candidatus Dormibacteraeota bacterium]